jgi:hypothetical protein
VARYEQGHFSGSICEISLGATAGADKARSRSDYLEQVPMPPREPQVTPPKTFAINSSRDMLEKLKREIERLAGSIIRQEVVDHGLNAAMTAWHLTDWTWKEIRNSPRLRSLTTTAGTPIRELKQFQELSKEIAPTWRIAKGLPSQRNISASRSSRCFPAR